MQPHRETIENLYAAFARLDADGMAACYASEARFDDEVFSLRGRQEVAGMWRMLCQAARSQGEDQWKLQWRDVQASGGKGSAHWDADYRFSATGRPVHNSVDSQFVFDAQGRILEQRDRFDFWHWSRQALGTPGVLLGWSPMLRKSVRQRADNNLRGFLARSGS